MSDIDGGAPAPVDSVSAPVADTPVTTPAPIRDDPIPAEPAPEPVKEPKEPKEPEKPVSTREALKKAAEKVEADNKAPKEAAKTEAKPVEKPRAEDGKFASTKPVEATQKPAGESEQPETPKPAKPKYEAPTSYSHEAKAEWEAVPENTRAAIVKRESEIAAGIEKYRVAHERDEALKDFHEMAAKGGTDVKTALTNYTNMERQLRENPMKGFEAIAANLGVPFRDIAAAYLGQPADQHQSQSDATIIELRNELAAIKQQVGGVTQSIKQQQEAATLVEVNRFSESHPRVDELSDEMTKLLNSPQFISPDLPAIERLSKAYELAERLNPAPVTAPASVSTAPHRDPVLQTDKGRKSINGAPSPGSNPGMRQPSTSIKESIRRAMAQTA